MSTPKSFEEVLKEVMDNQGPYQVSKVLADWCEEHAKQVTDRDWKAEYQLLAENFIRIHNRNWNSDKEPK